MNEIDKWAWSHHALNRAVEMALRADELHACLVAPDVEYAQPRRGEGKAIRQRGRIALAVDLNSKTVLTVLWRLPRQWSRADESLAVSG